VISAWTDAYGFLAEILIGRERQIYSTHAKARNGWVGFKPFHVVRIAPESEIITSFYLRPADGGGLPLSKPGQYITVRVPDARGQTTMRNCSLSNAPGEDHFRISVKQEPKGFVSAFLHESSKVIVDSTVQEKNVSYPLDTKQYRKIILRCWKLADKNGVGLRRRYRKEVRACIMAQRCVRIRAGERQRAEVKGECAPLPEP